MASVTETESEVFGGYVEEIDVYVEVECGGVWLCCGWNYLGFVLAGKAAQDWRWSWGWCQVSDVVLGCLRVIKEIKSTCGGRGF
jgi:hypothetical protein